MRKTVLWCLLSAAVALAAGYALPRPTPTPATPHEPSLADQERRLRDSYVSDVTMLDSRARNAHLAGDDGPVSTLDADRRRCYVRYRDAVRMLYVHEGKTPPTWAEAQD